MTLPEQTTFSLALRRLLVAVAAACIAAPAPAADEDITIVGSRVDPLPLYAAPGDTVPAASTAASNVPLKVREVRGDFLRVNVGGRDLWVDAMNVRSSRKPVARCGTVAAVNGSKVAGELGAGSDRCK